MHSFYNTNIENYFVLDIIVMSLQLSVVPSNAQATVNLSWSGSAPVGIIEYLIFYYQVGSVRVKSISTNTLSTVIPNLTNGVTYNFRATAFLGGYSNGTQLTETSMVQVICATQPDAPTNIAAVVSTVGNIISQQIQLSWTASFSNASHPVLNYKIYLSSALGNSVIVTTDATASYNLTGLVNGTLYSVRIAGVNLVGEGAQCTAVTATPLGLAGPPTNVVINYDPDVANSTSPGYQSVDLSYEAPGEDGGSSIVSYTIIYSLDPAFNSNVQSVSVTGTLASVQDANLVIPFADRHASTGWFYFKVCAVTDVGAGPFTSAVTLVAEIVPTAVTNLVASNLDENGNHAASTVTVSWSYDIDNSTPLLGYIIAYLDTSDEMHSIYVNDVSEAPAHTISDLQNGVSYEFSVFGINMLGAGPSLSVTAIPSTVPDAPEVSISHGNHSIQLDWFAPYDEGSAITGFKIYKALGQNGTFHLLATVSAGASSYADSALTNGSYYKYEISALNANGEGPRSATAIEYPSTVPSAPTNIALVNSQGQGFGGELTISWYHPPLLVSTNGGSPVIQFDVTDGDANLVGSVMAVVGQPNYSMPISNLINGQTYAFSVCAVNRDGQGAEALSPNAVPSGLPDAPSGMTLTNADPQGAGGEVLISVNALNVASGVSNVHPSDEGSAFDTFHIYRDGVAMESFNGTQFYYGGLVNGQLYNFALAAVNGNGEGAQCAQAGIVPSCCPDAVTGLSAVHGNSQAALSWTPLAVAASQVASDEGSPILQYQIQRSSDGGTTWNAIGGTASNVSSFVAIGLTNGTVYDFRISAQNANGISAPSAPVQCTPSTSPSAVQNVHIVGMASELHIIWDAPANSGGLPYLYDVEVADSVGGVAFTASALSTRCVEATNLTMNVSYTVTIFAYNSVDTNYVLYSTQSTTIPNPIEITSLEWDNTQSGLSVMKWNYNSDVYAAIDFLLVISDQTSNAFCSVFVPARNAVPGETIVDNGDGSYSYSYALSSLNTACLELNEAADTLKVMAFARNADGISPMSNVAQVR
jgi:hypothetical protein